MERPRVKAAGAIKDTLQKVLDTAGQFEIPGLFARFLQQCSALISAWLRISGEEMPSGTMEKSIVAELWRRELNRTMAENESFNISPPMAMERLFEALKTGMV
jgi:hypothetical protein